MANLFPVFEIPLPESSEDVTSKSFKPSPLFDFELGDFVRDGANRVVMVDGHDAYMIWVLKVLKIQQGACLCYMDAGINYEEALSEVTREAVRSAFERTITDALMCHPCTERVYDFEFDWVENSIAIAFTVKPKTWAAFDINMSVVE